MNFGDMLQKARVERHISLRDLGRLVGLSPVYLSDMERGQRRPPPTTILLKLIQVLQVEDPSAFLNAAYDVRNAVELSIEDQERRATALALAREWEHFDSTTLKTIREAVERFTSAPEGGLEE